MRKWAGFLVVFLILLIALTVSSWGFFQFMLMPRQAVAGSTIEIVNNIATAAVLLAAIAWLGLSGWGSLTRSLFVTVVVLLNVVLLYSFDYWSLSATAGSCFARPLTRTDSVYFTVATLTTTGFGDLAPVTQQCRGIVTAQMITGLFFLGGVLAGAGRAFARAVDPSGASALLNDEQEQRMP